MADRGPIEDRRRAPRRLGNLSGAAALDGFVGDTGALRAQWSHLDPARLRAIISTVVPRIIINPAVQGRNRFDPERIPPIWRA